MQECATAATKDRSFSYIATSGYSSRSRGNIVHISPVLKGVKHKIAVANAHRLPKKRILAIVSYKYNVYSYLHVLNSLKNECAAFSYI